MDTKKKDKNLKIKLRKDKKERKVKRRSRLFQTAQMPVVFSHFTVLLTNMMVKETP